MSNFILKIPVGTAYSSTAEIYEASAPSVKYTCTFNTASDPGLHLPPASEPSVSKTGTFYTNTYTTQSFMTGGLNSFTIDPDADTITVTDGTTTLVGHYTTWNTNGFLIAETNPHVATKLDAPTLTLTSGAGTCTIAASAKSDYADKLVIQYDATSEFTSPEEIETANNSFVQNTLNGTYYFRAKWTSTEGTEYDSDWSSTSSIEIDGTAPVITGVQTDNPLSINVGTTENLLSGVTCLDNRDGNLQVYYTIKNSDGETVEDDNENEVSIDTDCLAVGSYTIHYYATDAAGNRSADITRSLTVQLIKLTAPTVTTSSTENSVTFSGLTNANASSVEVRYATTSAGLESATAQTVTPTNGSYTISGLTLGTTYYFQARFTGDNVTYETSNWSTAILATTQYPPLPKPDITATATDWNTFRITGLNNANAVSYQLYVATGDSAGTRTEVETRTVVPTDGIYDYTRSDLNATRLYYFQARFIGDNSNYSNSPWSDEVHDVTLPKITATQVSESTIRLGGFVTQYSLIPQGCWQYRMATSLAGLENAEPVDRPARQILSNDTIVDVTGLSANTTYYFQARFYTTTGGDTWAYTGSWSKPVSAKTAAPALSAPTVIAVATGSSTVQLYGLSHANASSVQVRYATTSAGLESATAQTVTPVDGSCSISGLSASTTYYFQARFVGDGTRFSSSNWSSAVSATTGATADDDDLLYPEFKTLETTFGTMTVPFLTGSGLTGIIKRDGVL